jgi:hypothetical protein
MRDKTWIGFLFAFIFLAAMFLLNSCAPLEDKVIIQDRYWTWDRTVMYQEGDEAFVRCVTSTSGFEMPEVQPLIGCAMEDGDYVEDSISYHAEVKAEEEYMHYYFRRELWEMLEPDSVVVIDVLFGNIQEVTWRQK